MPELVKSETKDQKYKKTDLLDVTLRLSDHLFALYDIGLKNVYIKRI